jgi:hypothetical protein
MSKSKSLATQSQRNSMKELQIKMELDELKHNLLKETKNRNKYGSSGKKGIRKNNSQFGPHDTLCNYSNSVEHAENHDEKTVRGVLRKMLDFKKTNHFLSKEILDKQKTISTKEKIVLQLYDELRFHMTDNEKLRINYEEVLKLKSECEVNRNGVSDFCKNLKNKFKSFVKLIDSYEDRISDLNKDRENIISTNESIIDMKCKYKCL